MYPIQVDRFCRGVYKKVVRKGGQKMSNYKNTEDPSVIITFPTVKDNKKSQHRNEWVLAFKERFIERKGAPAHCARSLFVLYVREISSPSASL